MGKIWEKLRDLGDIIKMCEYPGEDEETRSNIDREKRERWGSVFNLKERRLKRGELNGRFKNHGKY